MKEKSLTEFDLIAMLNLYVIRELIRTIIGKIMIRPKNKSITEMAF